MLERDLRRHFRKYGREGGIILADGKKFFPSANHDYIFERHEKFIFDEELKNFGDAVVKTVKGGIGMPLGVEPSQAEMIAYPSQIDNYLILSAMFSQAEKNKFTFNPDKTNYIHLDRPFRYCKTKYFLTESSRVVAGKISFEDGVKNF